MKHISKNSKKGLQYLHAFEIAKRNDVNSLHKVYKNYSAAKCRAFENCKIRRFQENALTDGYILSANCMQFTYAFETTEGLRVETAYNSYIIF